MRRASDSKSLRGAAAGVLLAAAWVAVAGRLSVWFDLHADGFGANGFIAPAGTTAVVLPAVCVAIGVLAIVTIIRPGRRLAVALAISALALSVGGLLTWWSEATVDADFPAGALRETPVEVLVSPSTAGWVVLAALLTMQGAAAALLPRRQATLIVIGLLVVGTVTIGLSAPDQLFRAGDQDTVVR